MSRKTIETRSTRLKQYLQVMAELEKLTRVDEEACLKATAAGDEQARKRLVESYLPKVVSWVAGFRGGKFRFDELIEMGNQALIVAVWSAAHREVVSLEEELESAVRGEIEKVLSEEKQA